MSDSHIWPTYLVAPPDSVHAVGVASINYTRLEYAVTWLLSEVSGMTEDFARMTLARLGMRPAIVLLDQMLDACKWAEISIELLRHFTKAAHILTENRNMLIHSNLVHGMEGKTTFYRISKQGRQLHFDVELSEIRQVADDLDRYFWFGHALANAIAVHVLKLPEAVNSVGHAPWPRKPPLPTDFHT